MWKKELKPDAIEKEMDDVKGRVGDEESWYKKQVEYWDVRNLL